MQARMTNRINQVFVLLLLGLLPAHYASAQDIPGDGTTTVRLFAPGIFSSDIASATDQDVLRVRLISGGAYQIDAAATSDTLDPRIALYPPGQSAFGDCTGSAGVLVANDDIDFSAGDLNARITHTATQTGDHLLCADGAGATTGNYRLTATVTSAPPTQPRATISAPDTFITIAETALNGTTLTVTLENTEYETSPTAGQFTLNLSAGTGVTVSNVARDSATAATLTLAYTDSTGIDANTRIGVTVAGAAHTSAGDLTTDNMLRVVATAPTFAGMQPIANQTYLANSAITDLTLPAASGGEGTLSYSLAPTGGGGLPNGLTFDADTRVLSGTPDTEQAATGYTYTVTAGDGNTATLGFTIEVLSLATGLTAVRDLVATERRGRVVRIALTWLPPATVPAGTSVSSYEIQGCSAADTDCVVLTTSNHVGAAGDSQSSTLFRVTFNFYRVRARTTAGVSPWANVALTVAPGVVVDPENLPSMVQNLVSSALADNSVTLTWEAPTDATDTAVNRYVVARGFPAETATLGAFAPPGAEAVVTIADDVFTYADSGLLPGTEYLYGVFASSNAGDGEVAQLLVTTTGTLTTSIAGVATGAITEGATAPITGRLTITTTSGNSEFVPAFVPVDPTLLGGFDGAYGVFAIGTDGVWTYSLNYNLPRVRALTEGASVEDMFTVTAAAPTADGVAVTQVVTITITGVNTRPNAAIRLVEGSTVSAGETLRLESDITDPDNELDDLTIAWTAAGGIGTFSAAASADTDWMVPAATPPAEYLLTLTVTDDPGGASDTEQVSITVNALGFGGETIDDQTYTMGAAITDLTLPAATGGTGPYSYALSGMPSGLAFDSGTRVLSGTPNAEQAATSYTYTATDAASPPGTGTLAFTIEVAAPAPVPTVGGDLTGTATPLVIDAAGDTVSGGTASGTLVVSNVPPGVTPSHRIETDTFFGALTVDSVTGAWSYQIDNSRPFTRSLSPSQGVPDSGVIITTLGALEITSTVRITLPAGSFPDDPPTATAMVNGIDGGGTAEASTTVTLSGAGSDPEDDPITGYAWAQTGGTTVTLAPDATTAEVTFTAPASPETLAFTLTVMTATQTSPALSVAVEVTAAPLGFGGATITNQTYIMGTPITDLTLPVATGGTGPYSYALSDMPSGLAFDSDARVLSGTPDTAQAATTYTYTATDMASPPATVMQSFTIEVAAAATAAITASNPASLTEANLDGATLTVTLTGTTYADPLPANPVTLNTEATNNGLTVMAARGSDTEATLTLTYDGTDFDTDLDIIVTVADAAHAGTGDLDTGTVTVAAIDEDIPGDGTTTTRLAVPGTFDSIINPDSDQDGFLVALVSGGAYQFDAERTGSSLDLDTTIGLYPPGQADFSGSPNFSCHNASGVLAGNDDFPGGRNSRITWTATQTGDHLLCVDAFGNSRGSGPYRVTAAVTSEPPAADDATLSALTLSGGATLTPDFAAGTLTYTADVANNVADIMVTPTATVAGATITVNGDAVTSGSASTAITLTAGMATDIDVLVTATDGSTTQTYNLAVTRAAAPTAAISDTVPDSLTEANLDGATLTVTLTGTTYVNTLPANPVTLNAAATAAGVTVMTAVRDSVTEATLTLAHDGTDFDTDLDIIVTVADAAHAGTGDLDTGTVTVTAVAENNNANLSALTLSAGTLTPDFDAATTTYAAMVDNSVSSLTLTPTVANAFATIIVAGTAVTSGTASGSVELAEGPNAIAVEVTATDGSTTQTYTVTVTRAAAPTAAISDTVPDSLTEANLDGATLTVTLTGTTYEDPLPANPVTLNTAATTAGVTVTAVRDSATEATLTLAFDRAASDFDTDLDIIVTVADVAHAGTGDLDTGTVTVTAVAENNNADLSALTLSAGTLTPDFDAATTTYAAMVDNSVSSLIVTPTVANAFATITVADTAVASGMASGRVDLVEGANAIAVEVTATDGSTTQTYTVTVTRAAASGGAGSARILATNPTTLTEANLNGATVTVTLFNTEYVPAGSLQAAQFTPTGTVPGVTVMSVSRTDATNAVLTLAYDGTDFDTDSFISLSILAAAHTGIGGNLAVRIGATGNVVSLPVTAVVENNNANLSALTLSAGMLTPTFVSATTSYTAIVDNSVSSLTLTPTVANAFATITVAGTAVASGTASGSVDLDEGPNAIDVVVTATDGSTTQTYTVTVTRAAPGAASSVATLSGLTLSGGATLNPVFAPATLSYAADVAASVVDIMVTPTATDAAATIAVNGTAVNSGAASTAIALTAGGATPITVLVTAEDGSTTQTYNLAVTRRDPDIISSVVATGPSEVTVTFSAPVSIVPSGDPNFAGSALNLAHYSLNGAFLEGASHAPDTTVSANAAGTALVFTLLQGTTPVNLAPAPGDILRTLLNLGGVTNIDPASGNARVLGFGGPSQRVPWPLPDAGNAKLSALTLSGGATLTPTFDTGTFAYTADVANGVADIMVTPTVTISGATITVQGNAVTSGAASTAIALTAGAATDVAVVITATDGSTTQTYRIAVTRAAGASPAALIQVVTPSGPGVLSEANLDGTTVLVTLSNTGFVASTGVIENATNYRVNGLAGLTISAASFAPASSGVLARVTIEFAYDDTDFDADTEITVTVLDAVHTGTGDLTTGTETVTAIDETSRLSALSLSEGALDPVFNAGTFAYAASVANSIDGLTVTPTAAAGTTITVDGTPVNSGAASAELALTVGANTITVAVTAPRADAQDYTLTVTREMALSFGGADTGGVTEDTATTTATGTLTVTNPNTGGSTEVVAQTDADGIYGTFTIVAASGAWTYTLNNANAATNALAASETVTDVFTVVAAADPGAITDVTITITGANDAPTADAGDDQTVALSATVTLDGSASADPDTGADPGNADAIDSYAWTQDSGTNVTLDDATAVSPTFTAPNSAGDLVFSLVVNDGDADSAPATVTITVTDAPAATISATTPDPLTEANLNAATLTVTLINTTYQDPLPADPIMLNTAATTAGVTATAARVSATEATLTLAFDRAASDFDTDLDITVTVAAAAHANAGDLDAGTVTATAIDESDVATLSALTLSGGATLTPVFDAGTFTYTADVDNSVANIMVTPTATDDGATIEVQGTAVTSGSASTAITLTAGVATDIAVLVTAEDGTTQTYNLAVTRAAALALSFGGETIDAQTYTVNTAIAGLTLPTASGGTGTLSYSLSGMPSGLAFDADTRVLSGTPDAVQAATTYTYTATDAAVSPASVMLDLVITVNAVVVPSATISATTPDPLTEANLDGATLTVTLTNTTYGNPLPADPITLDTAATTAGVTATAVRDSATEATLTLAFDRAASDFDTDLDITVTVAAAAHANAGDLDAGTVTATAIDESDVATLSALTLSGGATLNPVFAPATLTYTADVDNSVANIMVTPTATDGGATIEVQGTAVTSGSASTAITLTAGVATDIAVLVTAEDGTTQTYNLAVTRAAATTPTAAIATPSSLTEATLDGATVTVMLTNTEYVPGVLATNLFTVTLLSGSGVTVSAAARTSAVLATLTLAYGGTGIDANTTLGITVLDAAHSGTGNLDTATIPLTATPPSLPGATFSVAENAAANTPVGTPLAPDNFPAGSQTWAIVSGNTGNDFAINPSTGQLSVAANDSINFEDTPSYTLMVSLTVGTTAMAQAAVTVTVSDVDEPPAAPAAPTVAPAAESLNVSWTAPANSGPAITRYDVQFRTGVDVFALASPGPGTATSLTITGLTANTAYEVQVRAANAEGDGAYSASGSGTPLAAGAPTATITTTAPTTLTEANLNGAMLTVTLTNATYVGTLTASQFTLTGAPGAAMISVESVTGSGTQAVLVLAYPDAGADLDSDLNLSVVVDAAAHTGTNPLTTGAVTVTDNAAPVIVNPGSQTYVQGMLITPLMITVTDTDTPTITVRGLPTGLLFNLSQNQITGTPDATVVAMMVTITADDGVNDMVTETFTITVTSSGALSFGGATIDAQTYTVNTAITDLTLPVVTGGTGPYGYALPDRPSGLSFNAMTRVLSGTPDTEQMATTYTYTATDSALSPAAVTLALVVTVEPGSEVTGGPLEGARSEAMEMTLGAFGRSFASGAVEVLDERFSSGAGGSQLTFGGRTLSLESLTNGQAAANAGAEPDNQPVSATAGGQQTSVGALFAGSAFQLSLNEGNAAGVGATTLWARGSVGNYEGEPEDGFQLDGDIVSGYLGLDYRASRRTLVGVAVSHSRGDADFSSAAIADGEVETELTSILPYVQWQPHAGLSLWGLVGYGLGESEITDSGESRKTDVEMQTAALGARGKLWSGGRADVALKASALTVEIESDSEQNLSSVTTRAHRLRMALAGNRHGAASARGGRFGQRFELGLRWDLGDVETGAGADLGAGVEYANPRSGTRLRLDGHYLLVHEESDFEAWEVSAEVGIAPSLWGRGVRFALQPGWDSAGARQRMVMDFTDVLGPAWRGDGLKLELYGEHAEDHEFGLEGSVRY